MNHTTVAMTFVNRHYEPEIIELIHAWDIDSLEENPTGYEDTKREAIASLGSDLLRWVTVEVNVPDQGIRDALLGEVPAVQASEPVITSASDR